MTSANPARLIGLDDAPRTCGIEGRQAEKLRLVVEVAEEVWRR